MSGHSKWHNIQAKKGKADAARGAIFTKIGREIAIAVRAGGPNPDNNTTMMWVAIAVVCIILPAVLSLIFSEIMRKLGWIKQGDLKLDL